MRTGTFKSPADGLIYNFHDVQQSTLEAPASYDQLLSWTDAAQRKALAYDVWARGNYVRHLSHTAEFPPLLIPFRYLDELRCYHRRVAIMGMNAQYLYIGELPKPMLYECPHPSDDYLMDAGAGWVSALGSISRMNGRDWFMIVGYSRPMPEIFVEWLTTEAREDFRAGRALIAPAPLVGISASEFSQSVSSLATLAKAETMTPVARATELLFNLDLPYVEDIDSSTFNKILEDNEHRLYRLRRALSSIVGGENQSIDTAFDELKDAVAEITIADGGMQFRETVTKFGGAMTTFGIGLSAYGALSGSGAAAVTKAAAAAGGAVAGATTALVNLLKQSAERQAKRNEHRFSLVWDLGVRAPCKLKRTKRKSLFKKRVRSKAAIPGESYNCHWLCPPAQMRHLVVRES